MIVSPKRKREPLSGRSIEATGASLVIRTRTESVTEAPWRSVTVTVIVWVFTLRSSVRRRKPRPIRPSLLLRQTILSSSRVVSGSRASTWNVIVSLAAKNWSLPGLVIRAVGGSLITRTLIEARPALPNSSLAIRVTVWVPPLRLAVLRVAPVPSSPSSSLRQLSWSAGICALPSTGSGSVAWPLRVRTSITCRVTSPLGWLIVATGAWLVTSSEIVLVPSVPAASRAASVIRCEPGLRLGTVIELPLPSAPSMLERHSSAAPLSWPSSRSFAAPRNSTAVPTGKLALGRGAWTMARGASLRISIFFFLDLAFLPL